MKPEAGDMPRAGGNPHGLGIDHLLFLVRDLESSAAALERLGFTVTPRGLHSSHLGTANHTVMLQEDYIELIGVMTPTPHNQLHRDNLRKGEGLHTAAITTDSIEGTIAALRECGMEVGEPVAFSRPVEMPAGDSAVAAFEIVRPARSALPKGFMFFCRHRTPETVWVPAWMAHANTAQRIAAVVMAAEDPAASARVYRKLFASDAVEPIAGGMRIATGKADLELLAAEAIDALYRDADVARVGSESFKVARIAVRDLAAARRTMEANGIPAVAGSSGSIFVPPSHGCGTLIEFVADGSVHASLR